MEKYEYLCIVGEGTYGKVAKAINKETGQFVAIKKFKDSELNQNVKKTALREIRILKQMKHPNIVNLLEVYSKNKRIYLIFEFIDFTVLQEIEKKPSGLDLQACKKTVYQLLLALNFCHSQGIIHRDVKPENLLVSNKNVLKLCDFGFARHFKSGQKLTEYVSTRWYRAPELLVGGKDYGFPVDVWSVGCVFYEMLTGQPLFPGVNDSDTLFKILKIRGNLKEDMASVMIANPEYAGLKLPKFSEKKLDETLNRFPSVISDFLLSCLEVDPLNRAKVQDLLKHRIFENSIRGDSEKEHHLASPKKVRHSVMNFTPEPTSYLKILEKKKSPNSKIGFKHSDESIRLKKHLPFISRAVEKPGLLPDIQKIEKILKKKNTSKVIKKMLEIRTDNKSNPKAIKVEQKVRNPSLSYEVSNDSLMKSSFANVVLSNRHQNMHKKDSSPTSTEHLKNIGLPYKNRLRKYEAKSTLSRLGQIEALVSFHVAK